MSERKEIRGPRVGHSAETFALAIVLLAVGAGCMWYAVDASGLGQRVLAGTVLEGLQSSRHLVKYALVGPAAFGFGVLLLVRGPNTIAVPDRWDYAWMTPFVLAGVALAGWVATLR